MPPEALIPVSPTVMYYILPFANLEQLGCHLLFIVGFDFFDLYLVYYILEIIFNYF